LILRREDDRPCPPVVLARSIELSGQICLIGKQTSDPLSWQCWLTQQFSTQRWGRAAHLCTRQRSGLSRL